MKADLIKAGRIYSDQKQGLRRVLEIGASIRTCGKIDDAVGVRYEVLAASKEPYVGTKSSMELKSFASWAKCEIPTEDVTAHLTKLQAEKVAGKLTEAQRNFLLTFDGDLTEATAVECSRKEFRVAAACQGKGIIGEMPESLDPRLRCFDVRFTPVGLAVLAVVQGTTR
jgi:hypothetical protein